MPILNLWCVLCHSQVVHLPYRSDIIVWCVCVCGVCVCGVCVCVWCVCVWCVCVHVLCWQAVRSLYGLNETHTRIRQKAVYVAAVYVCTWATMQSPLPPPPPPPPVQEGGNHSSGTVATSLCCSSSQPSNQTTVIVDAHCYSRSISDIYRTGKLDLA